MRSGISVARQMGISWVGRRAQYALERKLHLLRWRFPTSTWDQQPLSKFVRENVPVESVPYATFRRSYAGKFFFQELPTAAQVRFGFM